jgi:hypothetical protein
MESLAQLPGPPYFRTLHMSAEAISTSGRKACELLKMAPGPKIPGRPAAVQLAAFLKSGSIQTNPPLPPSTSLAPRRIPLNANTPSTDDTRNRPNLGTDGGIGRAALVGGSKGVIDARISG